jgi:hypothetical protein
LGFPWVWWSGETPYAIPVYRVLYTVPCDNYYYSVQKERGHLSVKYNFRKWNTLRHWLLFFHRPDSQVWPVCIHCGWRRDCECDDTAVWEHFWWCRGLCHDKGWNCKYSLPQCTFRTVLWYACTCIYHYEGKKSLCVHMRLVILMYFHPTLHSQRLVVTTEVCLWS